MTVSQQGSARPDPVRYASPEHVAAPRRPDQPAFVPLTGSVVRGRTAGSAGSVALPSHIGQEDRPRNFVVSAELERARAEATAEAAQLAAARDVEHRTELQGAYNTGVADGRELADREGLAALQALVAAVTEARREAADAATAQVRADTGDILEVAAVVATWAIERELAADTNLLLARLDDAVDGLVFPDQAAVACNPADVSALQTWRETRAANGLPGAVELDADPAMPRGQARVRCAGQVADLTAPAAVRRALASLKVEAGAP